MAGRHWNTRNLRVDTSPGLVPPGLIVMWSGAQVPPGWALCDGANGTPDLRDRFLVCAGLSYGVGAMGGVDSHSHSHTMSGQTDPAPLRYVGYSQWSEWILQREHTHPYSTTTGAVAIDNRPPYYALAFIMKLPYTPPPDGTHYNEGNLSEPTGLLPRGAIVAWSGSVSSIPQGWALCDGQSGTPDLRDRFVVGAGRRYSVGATGGSASARHSHTFSGTTGYNTNSRTLAGVWNNWYAANADHRHTFSGVTDYADVDNRPPYYALAFIMRVA